MRYLVALFFPWISFFTIGKIGQGFICLLLQLTVIGWLPATIWAMVSVGSYNADKRTDRIVNAMNQSSQPSPMDPRRI
ncbi:MAG TPA: YqaE/Pmp3 family membrane protein [Stellaceae bacterium]|nr:YqaE/Pmp3 family membrane protein [Stellaceae bacterium]